jgi:hypothetical protein
MSATTMIFQLRDEDEDLDLAAEPVQQTATHPRQRRRRSGSGFFGVRHGEEPSWNPSEGPEALTWADGELPAAERSAEASLNQSEEDWERDPQLSATGALFERDLGPSDDPESWIASDPERLLDADSRRGWSGWPGRSLRGAGSSRSWSSDRALAVGAIAILALLVVAIGHSARQAGRGSVGQRPVAAAAVGASPGVPLPASAVSPHSGRRPPPRPPAAPLAKPRGAQRHQRSRPRLRPAKAPAGRPRVKAAALPAPEPASTPLSAAAPAPAPEPAPAPAPAPLQVHSAPTPRSEAPPASTPAEFSFER